MARFWSWRSRRPAAGAGPPGPVEAPAEPEQVRLHSLALGDLLNALVPGGAYRFLDLGPAVGSNIEYLSRFALSVQVADLWASLSNGEPRSWEKALQTLAPGPESPGFHAVLAWDLLNYLPRPRVRELAERLAAATRPGGYVFALVYYRQQMPAEPLRFRIADRETLTYLRPAALRPAPRYPQGAVEQAFAEFGLEKGYLLKTGLQEFLFARKPAAPAAAEPPGPEETHPI